MITVLPKRLSSKLEDSKQNIKRGSSTQAYPAPSGAGSPIQAEPSADQTAAEMALHDVESKDDEAENLWGQAPEANAAGRKSCRCRRARSDEFVREIQMRTISEKMAAEKISQRDFEGGQK